MIIRRTTPEDDFALTQLAALDSQQLHDGDYLAAVVDGRMVAAVSLASDQVMADPFEPTADLVAMLEMRAMQMVAPVRPLPKLRARFLPQRGAAFDS